MSEDKDGSNEVTQGPAGGEHDAATAQPDAAAKKAAKLPKPPGRPTSAKAKPAAIPPSKPAAPQRGKAPQPSPGDEAASDKKAAPAEPVPESAVPEKAVPESAVIPTRAPAPAEPTEVDPVPEDARTEAMTAVPPESPAATETETSKSETPKSEKPEASGDERDPQTAVIPVISAPTDTPQRDSPPVADAPTEAIPTVDARPVRKPHAEPRRIPARGEAPTDAPRRELPQPRKPAPQAKPQRVGPVGDQPSRRAGRRWIGALAAAIVVIVAVGVAGYLYLARDSGENSPEAQIRTSITSFTQALTSGDLATLRTASCGDLAAYYRDIPDAEFADVHRVAVEQGNVPVVDGVDAVQITGDTAIAQVIAYTAANPTERSPRTFDLRLEGEDWKVCNPA